MKYIVVLGDGMADRKLSSLNDKTPLQVANKPNIDALACVSEIGYARRLPTDLNRVATLLIFPFSATTCVIAIQGVRL